MSETPRAGFKAVIAREWWLVLITIAAAGLVAMMASKSASTAYVGTATVTVNQPALAKYPTMLFGDRMLDVLESADFETEVAQSAGMDASDVRSNFSATATGKLLDRINVRFTAKSADAAKKGTTALAAGVVNYAQAFSKPELDRLRSVADAGDAVVEKVRALQKKIGNNAFEQAEIETQLAIVEQTAITNRSAYELAASAYAFDGKVAVAARTGSRGIDLIAGALLAGLIAGLVLAAVRERMLANAAA